MKKTFFLLLTTLFIVGCNSNGYKLSIKFDQPSKDSTRIIIQQLEGEEFVLLADTTIEGNKLSLKGQTEFPTQAGFSYMSGEKTGFTSFVLENGHIKLNVHEDNYISVEGTPQNDLLKSLSEQKEEILGKDLYRIMQSNARALTEEQRVEYKQKAEDINKVELDFMKQNINSTAGQVIFIDKSYNMPLEEQEEIIDLMNEQTRTTGYMPLIIEYVENAKKQQ